MMAMEQTGYVARIENGIAKIRVDRESACGGNCGACHGCPQTAVMVSYPNDLEKPFEVGEEVRILMPTEKFFLGMLKSYGVLIFVVLAGSILGYNLTKTEEFAVLGAFLGLLLGGGLVHLLSKKADTDIVVQRMDKQEDDNEKTETN